MSDFIRLLRSNINYRRLWIGQVASDIGDHLNNIAVVSLAASYPNAGWVLTWLMVSRALPMLMAGPIAGVILDRGDRRRLMIASDLVRALVVLGFLVHDPRRGPWPLYVFSGLAMFASPFFTSGRSSIMPTITSAEELHTAISLTQITQWAATIVGSLVAGFAVSRVGPSAAFVLNSLSFVASAVAISRMQAPGGFRAKVLVHDQQPQLWVAYKDGLAYIRSVPLLTAVSILVIGWAAGGGAAQVLFGVFGESVFKRGPSGIGAIWGSTGLGLLVGASIGHAVGKHVTFRVYKRFIAIGYLVGGLSFTGFSVLPFFPALVAITISRTAFSFCSVLNQGRLLRIVPDHLRGRVFTTFETLTWTTMMCSMILSGLALTRLSPQAVGSTAGVLTAMAGLAWAWVSFRGKLSEPQTAPRAAAE